jgi:hypothetical protein
LQTFIEDKLEGEMAMDREQYGGISPAAWIIGAILVAAAIYWLFGGFG